MTSTRALTCGLVVLLAMAAAVPARAGEVVFSIRDGRVTLTVHNAPISDILAVWEKEGRTTIMAREQVQGMVTSLELVNEPEATALATVLRSVTGYIAAKRTVALSDRSIYRCIVINPAPAVAFVGQPAPTGRAAAQPQPNGWPPPSMGMDVGMNPPTFVPQNDDGEDGSGGGFRIPGSPGMRSPATALPPGAIGRPPFDQYGAAPNQTQRAPQPSFTPIFPGSSTTLPGAAAPAPQVPGSVVQPVRKPPGVPDRKF